MVEMFKNLAEGMSHRRVKILRWYEAISTVLVFILCFVFMFLNAGNIINTNMNGLHLLVWFVLIFVKYKLYEEFADRDDELSGKKSY
ncbi:MAG: hypothetical protein E7311_00460 [Clostridiales bacterium]|nr:hypothetical protein [Clostridiales bacterium]